MKPKEILVFGASGQIGRHLIRKLTKNNYKVVAVTRNIHQKGYILKTQAYTKSCRMKVIANIKSIRKRVMRLIISKSTHHRSNKKPRSGRGFMV